MQAVVSRFRNRIAYVALLGDVVLETLTRRTLQMRSKLLTVKESADQLGLSARTIWAWIYARKLGVVRLGRAVRIQQSAIDELIEEGTVPAKAER